VLTGVNIGDFGRSTGETFFDLCRALDQVEGVERYRIGSIEPNLLTDELLQWIAGEAQRFAPHFHIPLQAGSDEVLRLMRRRYDTALFRRKIELVKTLLPDAFIGVDVMAGMRGETAELFEQSYRFLESLPVSQLHPFTYSERTGTKALEIKPVIPVRERHERTARLVELSEKKLRDFYTSQMGTTRRVLWEQPSVGRPMHGFTENYIRVEAPYEASLINQCTEVVLGHRLGESSQGLVIL
jgi:threonylcarbamoyladenosine tRNA methylthiotransferase MtaB